jgi:outer membrane lipoprotein LolB
VRRRAPARLLRRAAAHAHRARRASLERPARTDGGGQASQSFSAGFELKGAPDAGELTLTNPLGGTLAKLEWSPGRALLRANGGEREFPSLADLAQEATGAPLPVAALFDWLAGKATPIDGWQPDVAQVANGRLRAHRYAPPPQADLRVVFER